MHIKKTYKEANPELLYDEVRDFVPKQGAVIGESSWKHTSCLITLQHLSFGVR